MIIGRILFFLLFIVGTALSQTESKQEQVTSAVKQFMAKVKQQEEKLTALQHEVIENPDSADAHYKLGNAYLEQITPVAEKALEEFQKAIRLKPDYAEAFLGLGNAYLQIEEKNYKGRSFRKMREAYHQAILLKPDYAEAYYALGANYLLPEVGDHIDTLKEAADNFSEAVRIKPDYVAAYSGLARAYRALGRNEEAIEALKKVKSLKPNDKVWTGNISNPALRDLYIKQGRYVEAIQITEEEVQDPDDPMIYFTLGDLYFQVGRYEDAISEYKKGINFKWKTGAYVSAYSRNYAGPQKLASLYVRMGRLEDAIEVCREVISRDAKNYEAYSILIKIYLQLGRNREAIETSRQAVREMPESVSVVYELGSTYLVTGDKQAAFAQIKIINSLAQNEKDRSKKAGIEWYANKLLEEINK